MNKPLYQKIQKEKLILRDHLAASRTVLANERTILAYVRTALALLVSGFSLIKFFESLLLDLVGWLLVPAGVLTLFVGWRRYRQVNKQIAEVSSDEEPEH